MANTSDLSIPVDSYLDLYSTLGVTSTQAMVIQNKGAVPLYIFIGASAPTAGSRSGYQLDTGADPHQILISGTDKCWITAGGNPGLISVQVPGSSQEGIFPTSGTMGEDDIVVTGTVAAVNANLYTGTATANSVVGLYGLNGCSTVSIQVTGTFVATLAGQYSVDGVNWVTLGSVPFLNASTGNYSNSVSAAGIVTVDVSAIPNFRLACTSYTSGTATITIRATEEAQMIAIDNPLPTGANIIGGVNLAQVAATTVASTAGPSGSRAMIVGLLGSGLNTDRASAALTVSGNSGVILDDVSTAGAFGISVTVFTATSLDIVLQETYDNGLSFVDIYHVPRITATGTYTVPPMAFGGRRRWVYTFSGTTCTFSIFKSSMPSFPTLVRNFYDRSASLISPNATFYGAQVFDVSGMKTLTLSAFTTGTAATAGATLGLQFSNDQTNFITAAQTVALPAATGGYAFGTYPATTITGRYCKVVVTGAGTGQTLSFVNLYGTA